MMSDRKRTPIFFAVTASLVIALLAAACVPSLGVLTQNQATATSAPVPNTGGAMSVTVKDQQLENGNTVVIADIVSNGAGWIAIHIQKDNEVGPVIAVAPVKDGDNKNVQVQVDPTLITPVMYAMLHLDKGVVGKYEFPGPDIPATVNSQIITPPFKVLTQGLNNNIQPSVTVNDQAVTNGKITIAQVTSPGPGWVAIHVQNSDGKPGADIGYTAVKEGPNTNIVVTVDPKKITPVMYAMLHTDAGEVGTYEYPGKDAPVQVDGVMVAPSFRVTNAPGASAVTGTPGSATTPQAGAASTATPDTMGSMPTATGEANLTMPTANPQAPPPVVMVSDQLPQNNMVKVDEVVSQGPGWIVIYTMGANGQPDKAIGHTHVNAGENKDVMVEVDPALAKGTLVAQLHSDEGQVGTFEYPGPDGPLMLGVQMVSGIFRITGGQAGAPAPQSNTTPAIKVQDQPIINGTVTLPEVDAAGDTWVVIHRQNGDGSMGDMVGYTLVTDGVHQNVAVPVDTTRTSSILYAMLHQNISKANAPQFPGVDLPVMVNGQMINPTFKVLGAGDVVVNLSGSENSTPHLINMLGMTLYLSLNDNPGKSNCTGDCLKNWKPLLVNGRIVSGDGIPANRLGVIVLPNGLKQVAYSGAPLYTYTGDKNPGDMNGQGIDGVWFIVTP